MENLSFDKSQFSEQNTGRRKVNDMLAFDPFIGALPTKVTLDPNYDEKIGRAWQIEDQEGREAANNFLVEQNLEPFPEADGK